MWQETNNLENSGEFFIPDMDSKIKPAKIDSVEKDSIAEEVGFESGDAIISINGKKPRDLIDYQILISEEILEITVLDKKSRIHELTIEKEIDTNLGINFQSL